MYRLRDMSIRSLVYDHLCCDVCEPWNVCGVGGREGVISIRAGISMAGKEAARAVSSQSHLKCHHVAISTDQISRYELLLRCGNKGAQKLVATLFSASHARFVPAGWQSGQRECCNYPPGAEDKISGRTTAAAGGGRRFIFIRWCCSRCCNCHTTIRHAANCEHNSSLQTTGVCFQRFTTSPRLNAICHLAAALPCTQADSN